MNSNVHDSIAFDYLPNLRKLIIDNYSRFCGIIDYYDRFDETFEFPKNKHFKQLEF